jgi:hypothetical protein
VFDPVDEPALKPSKTKPLPRWMNLLPNNVHRAREQKANTVLGHGSLQSRELDSPIGGRNPGSSDDSEDFKGSPIVLVNIPSLKGGGKVAESPTLPMTIPDKSHRTTKNRAISFDPKFATEKTHGNFDHRCYRKAQDSIYMTSPEFPSCYPPPPRRRTPYPQDFAHLPSTQKDASSYFSRSKSFSFAEELIAKACHELGATVQPPKIIPHDSLSIEGRRGQTPPKGSSTFPYSSSEHLGKY